MPEGWACSICFQALASRFSSQREKQQPAPALATIPAAIAGITGAPANPRQLDAALTLWSWRWPLDAGTTGSGTITACPAPRYIPRAGVLSDLNSQLSSARAD